MITAFGVGLVLALANAAHCAGMCGAFAILAARGKSLFSAFPAYAFGKLGTYVFLGTLAGASGASLLRNFEWAEMVLGLLVSAWLFLLAWRLLRGGKPSTVGRTLSDLISPALKRLEAPLLIGAVTGLLPCGVVGLALLEAARTRNAAEGGMVLAGLGLGTAPILLFVGWLVPKAQSRIDPKRLRIAGAVLLILVAAFSALRALWPYIGTEAQSSCPACH